MKIQDLCLKVMTILLTVAGPISARAVGGSSDGGSSGNLFDREQLIYLLGSSPVGGGMLLQSDARLKSDLLHFLRTTLTEKVENGLDDADAGYALSMNPGLIPLERDLKKTRYAISQEAGSKDQRLYQRSGDTITFYVADIATRYPRKSFAEATRLLGGLALQAHLEAFPQVSGKSRRQFSEFYDRYAGSTERDQFHYELAVADASVRLDQVREQDRGTAYLLKYAGQSPKCRIGDIEDDVVDGQDSSDGIQAQGEQQAGTGTAVEFWKVVQIEASVYLTAATSTGATGSDKIAPWYDENGRRTLYLPTSQSCFPRKWGCILGQRYCVGDGASVAGTSVKSRENLHGYIVAVWPRENGINQVLFEMDAFRNWKTPPLQILNANLLTLD